jgi:hypothetical protein
VSVRLRQVALVASDLAATCAALESALGVRDPFADPGVAEFGLHNAVYELGDTFLEVVSPARAGTTAGRYLEKRGGDAGYMTIFQVPDTPAVRARAATMGLRIVWQADLPDISGTHLHPKDMPGAIVSFDTPVPPETWRWGGPRWTGGVPAQTDRFVAGGITGVTVRLLDVDAGAKTWAGLLDGVEEWVRFAPAATAADEGIASVAVAGLARPATICGVRFHGEGDGG